MRTFDFVALGIALALSATKLVAENTTDTATSTTTTTVEAAAAPAEKTVLEVKAVAPDLLLMSSGSVLVVRGKQTSRLENEVRLQDGTILTPGGTARRPDGSSVMLVEGQGISPEGKLLPAPPGAATAPAVIVTEKETTVVP